MTSDELERFRKILEDKVDELAPLLQTRNAIAIERAPDMLDEVQLAGEREFATRQMERGAKLLRDVRAALGRMDDGRYGTCLDCEEEIGLKRLKALPWTPLCIGCQERSDNTQLARIEFKGHSLADAA
jgi:DnaK suppressor protein